MWLVKRASTTTLCYLALSDTCSLWWNANEPILQMKLKLKPVPSLTLESASTTDEGESMNETEDSNVCANYNNPFAHPPLRTLIFLLNILNWARVQVTHCLPTYMCCILKGFSTILKSVKLARKVVKSAPCVRLKLASECLKNRENAKNRLLK